MGLHMDFRGFKGSMRQAFKVYLASKDFRA